MKKILLLCLMLMVAATLVACAGDAGDAGVGGAVVGDAGGAAGEAAEAPAAGVTINIEFWDMMWGPADTYIPAVEALTARFNAENPYGIVLHTQMTPWDNFYQVFLTAIMAGAGPDASTGAGGQPIQYAALGRGLSLDPIVEAWRAENHPILNDFLPGMLEYYQFNGVQYGIPWNMDPRAMIYRTDIFEELGITSYPQTFDEFADVLRQIRDAFPDMIPFTFAAGDHNAIQVAIAFLMYNGTGFVDEHLNANMLSPEAMETWEFFQLLFEEGLIGPGTAGYRGPDLELLYATGEVAIFWGNPPYWLLGTDLYYNSGVMPPLRGPSAAAGRGGVNYFWINGIQGYNTTDHPDETRAVIRWWAENTLELFVEGNAGPMPVRASHFEHPFYAAGWIRPGFYYHTVSVGNPVVWPAPSLFPAFLQIEGENLPGNVLRGILTGQDILTIATQQNDLIIGALENH